MQPTDNLSGYDDSIAFGNIAIGNGEKSTINIPIGIFTHLAIGQKLNFSQFSPQMKLLSQLRDKKG